MPRTDIPDIVIGRLPLYLRALTRLSKEGHDITSSHELGEQLGISSAQIRKDLSHFGEFGKQGTGYTIQTLSTELQRILKVDTEWQVALVGIGHLGQAIANYGGFADRGFRISHLFDNSPERIGKRVNGLTVTALDEMATVIEEEGIRIAMIATPARSAQQVADILIEAGVQAILCYAPIIISVPEPVRVQYIDPVIHLQRMSYYIDD
ncbi:MAG: redox-sensing transcriptional repressor Rex [Chloroflexi bacterium]|nr:redox-sensing transcriptional repressor Rex [Chloroflexota bacterium]